MSDSLCFVKRKKNGASVIVRPCLILVYFFLFSPEYESLILVISDAPQWKFYATFTAFKFKAAGWDLTDGIASMSS